MVFYVPIDGGVSCFIEQKSFDKDRQSSLKLTNRAERSDKSMSLTQENTDANCEDAR